MPANGCRFSGNGSSALASRWFGTSDANFSNQKCEICVSTSPLRGMPLGMMTSKAEMRSLATNSRRVAEVEDFADLAAVEFFDAGQIELQDRFVCHAANY